MATQKFKFKLFTSSDPDAQYAAVTTKEPLTFYLLNNGKGYLGETKLFDATDPGVTISESIASDATGNTTDAASTKAVVDYVAAKISGLGVLTDKFFRAVKSHTITDADLTNTAISVPDGTQAGDVGLLFTSDNDSADGNEQYYFVSLKNYLSTVYTFGNTDSITFSTDENNNVTANLKIADGETGLVADATGLHLAKVKNVDESDPSDLLVTEDKMVSYVQNSVLPAVDTAVTEALKNVVTSEVDDGTGGSGSGSEGTGGTTPESTAAIAGHDANGIVYSTEETRIGTWINGEPLYRRVIIGKTPSSSDSNPNVKGLLIATLDKKLNIKNLTGMIFAGPVLNPYWIPISSLAVDCSDSNNTSSIWYDSFNGIIKVNSSTNIYDRDIEIIVEYTKPTQ